MMRASIASPALWGWNTLCFLIERHVGLLPYFLPIFLGLFRGPPIRGPTPGKWVRWSLLLAVAVAAGAFLLARPFNFYGGGGAIANRYFLPLYPALWFFPMRALSWRWIVRVVALAALFLLDSWVHPRSYPLTSKGTYRYVTPWRSASCPSRPPRATSNWRAGRTSTPGSSCVSSTSRSSPSVTVSCVCRVGAVESCCSASWLRPPGDRRSTSSCGVLPASSSRSKAASSGGWKTGGERESTSGAPSPATRPGTDQPVRFYRLALRLEGIDEEPVPFKLGATQILETVGLAQISIVLLR